MSGCADVCLDHGYDLSYSDFSSEAIVTARKGYTCCECGGSINPGQRYERTKGKSDGDFYSEATCIVCMEIRDAFVCGTWMFGQLWESIRDTMFPIWETHGPFDCLAKLTTAEAREMCRAEYDEWRESNS